MLTIEYREECQKTKKTTTKHICVDNSIFMYYITFIIILYLVLLLFYLLLVNIDLS